MSNWHEALASVFANPADIARYQRAILAGKSEHQALQVGDNGIGCWGDDTTADRPMCALHPEDWCRVDHPQGKLVEVVIDGVGLTCELRDKLGPKWAPAYHGRERIDLNDCAADFFRQRFGFPEEFLRPAKWRWKE